MSGGGERRRQATPAGPIATFFDVHGARLYSFEKLAPESLIQKVTEIQSKVSWSRSNKLTKDLSIRGLILPNSWPIRLTTQKTCHYKAERATQRQTIATFFEVCTFEKLALGSLIVPWT